jgi:hypothetical protein
LKLILPVIEINTLLIKLIQSVMKRVSRYFAFSAFIILTTMN